MVAPNIPVITTLTTVTEVIPPNSSLTPMAMAVVNDLGISYTHYAKIEEGMRSMSLKMLFMLVTYFNTDANTILGIGVKEAA